MLNNPHAGEILKKEFLQGITQTELAGRTGLTKGYVSNIINGNRKVSARASVLLGEAFGVSDAYFLVLQAQYDAMEARRKLERNKG